MQPNWRPPAVIASPALFRYAAVLLVAVVLAVLVPSTPASAATSYDLEARYTAKIDLDWDTRWVDVRTTIDIVNTSGRTIDRLELNSAAVKLGGHKDLRARVDGTKVSPSVVGQTIKVPLGRALTPGGTAEVFVGFRSRLQTTAAKRSYYFARLGGVAQLYRVIPWVSRKVPFGTGDHGEPFVTPVSPRVEVTVSSDRKLVWATTGRRIKKVNARTFVYVAKKVRDFNLAASPNWKSASGTSKNGKVRITAYTNRHDAKRLVRLAREELARYTAKTGVAYAHETYRVAETGGGLAMESPALIWIPRTRSSADLPYLVSHETAHQWWYSTVGNDQSTSAFADEALADYFSRKAHLSIRNSRCPTDRLDREIRAYSDLCYFEVIYIQGARFLDKMRRDYGNKRFMAAIRAYTKSNRHDISNNARLLEAFRAEMGDGLLKRFSSRFPSIY